VLRFAGRIFCSDSLLGFVVQIGYSDLLFGFVPDIAGCSDWLLIFVAQLYVLIFFALIGCSDWWLICVAHIDAHIFWAQDPALCIFI
jgi:hypothetical protein